MTIQNCVNSGPLFLFAHHMYWVQILGGCKSTNCKKQTKEQKNTEAVSPHSFITWSLCVAETCQSLHNSSHHSFFSLFFLVTNKVANPFYESVFKVAHRKRIQSALSTWQHLCAGVMSRIRGRSARRSQLQCSCFERSLSGCWKGFSSDAQPKSHPCAADPVWWLGPAGPLSWSQPEGNCLRNAPSWWP